MSTSTGWYVRVKTGETTDGVHDTVVYLAGCFAQTDAEAAVRRIHPTEPLWLLGEVVAGRRPQPAPGEVRLLKGMV